MSLSKRIFWSFDRRFLLLILPCLFPTNRWKQTFPSPGWSLDDDLLDWSSKSGSLQKTPTMCHVCLVLSYGQSYLFDLWGFSLTFLHLPSVFLAPKTRRPPFARSSLAAVGAPFHLESINDVLQLTAALLHPHSHCFLGGSIPWCTTA